jgi:dihydropteroate synthase
LFSYIKILYISVNYTMHLTKTLKAGGKLLDLSEPRIMGIINLTPDSFYQGSRYTKLEAIEKEVDRMLEEGVHILDLGGMSSRPGAEIISVDEELDRVLPALEMVRARSDVMISIDTIHSEVAHKCLNLGADIINDISGGDHDPEILDAVIEGNGAMVMMHMRGTPQTMTQLTEYPKGVTFEVIRDLREKSEMARKKGLHEIVVDPGFGFAKNVDQNFEMLRDLGAFRILEAPLLVGISRKSMIWRSLGVTPDDALNGTSALHMAALDGGANILRVHDVKEAREVITLWTKLNHR